MKKIAFITPHFYPSVLTGSGIFVMKLAEEFAKLGYDVSVITSSALTVRYWYDPIFGKKIERKYETYNKVKIYRLSCNQLYSSTCFILLKFFGKFFPKKFVDYLTIMSSGPYLISLDKILNLNNYDVIHCSPSPLAINKQVISILSKMKKKPKFIFSPFFHSQLSNFTNPELKKVFQSADIIHAVSNIEKKDISSRFLINIKKIIVVPMFLDVSNMHSVDELKNEIFDFKDKYKLKEKKIILFAGIKGYAKGAIDLLLAIDTLYVVHPEYILLAIGTDTLEWGNAKEKINKNCLLDFSYVEGKEKEVIFSACDIFCMPSKSDAFGIVYLEAWHKKRPVIAADIPAVIEFIDKDGVFVEFGNKEQIIEVITKLAADKNMASLLGKAGNKKLINTYTLSKVFPKYITLFTDN